MRRKEINLISGNLERNEDIISRLKDELELLSEQTLQYIDSSGWMDMEENQPGIKVIPLPCRRASEPGPGALGCAFE